MPMSERFDACCHIPRYGQAAALFTRHVGVVTQAAFLVLGFGQSFVLMKL